MTAPDKPSVLAFIEPRLDLCREIIKRMDAGLVKEGYDPVSADGFRQDITTVCVPMSLRIEDIVFGNPLYDWRRERLYELSTYFLSDAQRRLDSAVSLYWR